MRRLGMSAALVVSVLMWAVAAQAGEPRNGVDIPKLAKVAIDGALEDWGGNGFAVDALSVVAGRPGGKAGPKARLGWSDEGLLVAVVVPDTTPVEATLLHNIATRDCVEVSVASRWGGADGYRLLIGPGIDPTQPAVRQAAELRQRFLRGAPCQLARKKIDGGYVIEALLPWANLASVPAAGQEIAVQVAVNDADATGAVTRWAWYAGAEAGNFVTGMQRVRLADKAGARIALTAAAYKTAGAGVLAVRAEASLVGQDVEVRQGGMAVAAGAASAVDADAASGLALPASLAGTDWTEAQIALKGQAMKSPGKQRLAREAVVAHIQKEYLGDSAKTARIPVGTWGTLVGELVRRIKMADRKVWGEALIQTFAATDEKILALDAGDVLSIGQALDKLNTGEQAERMARLWLRGHLKELTSPAINVYQTAQLASTAVIHGMAGFDDVLAALDAAWLARHKAGTISMGGYFGLFHAPGALGSRENAQAWVLRSLEAALRPTNRKPSNLLAVSEFIDGSGLAGKGKAIPEFVAALVEMIQKGRLFEEGYWPEAYTWLGKMIGTKASQDQLRALLLDATGNPRQEVAMILHWSYRMTEQQDSWRAFLDEQVKGTTGDLKAQWLLARAYAENNSVDSSSPFMGVPFLNQALAAAVSQEARLVVVKTLVDGYLLAHGADVNKSSPLAGAVQRASVDMIRLLLNAGAKPGGTPVVYCVKYKRLDFLQWLVERGADVNTKGKSPTSGGYEGPGASWDSPLCIAVGPGGSVEIVRFLLERGARPNELDGDGAAMHQGARFDDVEIMELLIRFGGDVNLKDREGKTPLEYAKGHPAMEACLKKHGAKP